MWRVILAIPVGIVEVVGIGAATVLTAVAPKLDKPCSALIEEIDAFGSKILGETPGREQR